MKRWLLILGAVLVIRMVAGKIDYLLTDQMNYHYADWVYRKHGLEDRLTPDFFRAAARELEDACEQHGIPCDPTSRD